LVPDNVSAANSRITTALQAASRTTGTEFQYLVQTAARESAFNPSAQATTSSARGLFQFIESTWLGTMKEAGPQFGFARQAAAIEKVGEGKYVVRDPAMRAQILKMRDDPQISALMAGALAGKNAEGLAPDLGRKPTSGELYIAHFLGLNGAKKLIALKETRPGASAAAAFPEAAKANRSIFYERNGRPKSADAVYASLVAKHDRPLQQRPLQQPGPQAPVTQVAGILPSNTSRNFSHNVSREATVVLPNGRRIEQPAQVAEVRHVVVQLPDLESDQNAAAALSSEGPVFQTMFHNQPGPISNRVQEIWGRRSADAANANQPERKRYFPTNTEKPA
jgi:hypothetical protein